VLLIAGVLGGAVAAAGQRHGRCAANRRNHACAVVATARTGRALSIGQHAATLVGVVVPRGARTSYYFQYGAHSHYSSRTAIARTSGHVSRVVVRVRLGGLTAGTVYRYRIVASSRYGLSFGAGRSFRTARRPRPAPPRRPAPTPRRPPAAPAPYPGHGTPAVPPAHRDPSVYWGAEIGPQLTGKSAPWDMNAVSAFASLTGKPPSIVAFNIPFEGCGTPTTCYPYSFPTPQMTSLRRYGAIPLLNWSSMSAPLSVSEPSYRLAAVTGGADDSVIRRFATGAKAWGHPFLLRFDWEMNGHWFPWAEAANGNNPGDFVAAWRHVHDIFTAVGARNATWVWCPTADFLGKMTSLAELYPGDGYVDWTCIDGYNDGTLDNPNGWMTFDQVFSSTYRQITATIAPTKPMLIGEFASSEHGGSKAAWINATLTDILTNYPKIRGVAWFDAFGGHYDWPIETSATATGAFKRAIANPLYATNSYGRMATSPIPSLP
jgi:hypothetical protein